MVYRFVKEVCGKLGRYAGSWAEFVGVSKMFRVGRSRSRFVSKGVGLLVDVGGCVGRGGLVVLRLVVTRVFVTRGGRRLVGGA